MQFLGYIISSQDIWIEDERIKLVKNWPESNSVQDIQVFINFANFYSQFVPSFNKIAALLTLMFITTRISDSAPKKLEADDNKVIESGDKVDDRNLSKSKKSKMQNPEFKPARKL